MPTILVTGASSGIGAATVTLFLSKGWHVIATMRRPEVAVFPPHPHLSLLKLDVTEPDSIQHGITQSRQLTPQLDVLLNNAGYGLVGPLELVTPAQLQQQFSTNVFGLIHMTQAVLPWMRERGAGTIINVSSIGGRTTFPLYSLYHGTKWAVEGISESLAYELAMMGIQVKLIEPGPIKTPFYDRSMAITGADGALGHSVYNRYASRVLPRLAGFGAKAPGPEVVAQAIWRAANDKGGPMRYPVNTMSSLVMRRLLPEKLYRYIIRLLTNG